MINIKTSALITEKQIQKRVQELAQELNQKFENKKLIAIGIFKWGVFVLFRLNACPFLPGIV